MNVIWFYTYLDFLDAVWVGRLKNTLHPMKKNIVNGLAIESVVPDSFFEGFANSSRVCWCLLGTLVFSQSLTIRLH